MTNESMGPESQPLLSTGDVDSKSDLGTIGRGRWRRVWDALVGGIGLAMGLVPHILHHVGFLAGSALVAGSGGTSLFGALGFIASIPFLLRLRRRFGTWRAPAIGLLIFAAMFALSAFVIGPAISGANDAKPATAPGLDHKLHHQ
jgi:hypothetical protein